MTLVSNGESPNNLSGGSSLPTTPLKKSTPNRRARRPENSKFNRSVVSSKNCATYYFKHMDTDPDTAPDGWSSQETSEAYSEEEHWVYTNGNDNDNDNGNDQVDSIVHTNGNNDDETNENNISINMANLSMKVHCNESISIDVVDEVKVQQVSAS